MNCQMHVRWEAAVPKSYRKANRKQGGLKKKQYHDIKISDVTERSKQDLMCASLLGAV